VVVIVEQRVKPAAVQVRLDVGNISSWCKCSWSNLQLELAPRQFVWCEFAIESNTFVMMICGDLYLLSVMCLCAAATDWQAPRCCATGLQCTMFGGQGFGTPANISALCIPAEPKVNTSASTRQ
jgi:hypothetical protein